ncbi:MAG TPA: nitroreductase family deazaflavin-dependent oxidoreductase [Solirubrobacteraceae bacterium]|jgi:deazaflavin-dependent oxidoreductase (nitroreductase family)|nr:nitroreductase family deazaflavin-dependent oxidoreductase [Solirubrobacteraceae bacterium]
MADANDFNRGVIEEFRAHGGRVSGAFADMPILLLTSTGARSGERRTTPVVYLRDGERLVVFASKAGAPENPAWYHNLRAHPEVTVEVGSDTLEMRAEELHGEERDRLFAQQVEALPQFADYAERTERVIPVVALTRA